MRVVVVTIVAGRGEHLARQRAALARGPEVTHVVVGMGEEPALSARPSTVVVTVPVDGPLPLAHARNAGAAAALDLGAELLLFLDVDCIPGPTLVDRYAAAARVATAPALLCGPVTYLPPAPPGGYPPGALRPDPHPARPDPPDGTSVPEERRELFWSLSFAVTADAWRRSGGFCEDYRGYGGEDTDFALTARDRGLAMAWVGGAHAFHQHHPPARTDAARVAEIVANARLFHRRWGSWPMTGWLRELDTCGAVEFDPARDLLRVTPRVGSGVTPVG